MTDLVSFRSRLQIIMMDVNAKSWDTDTLDEVIRLALMDIGFAVGQELTIANLADANATTLSTRDQGALLVGASAYAAWSRSLDLSEKVSAGTSAEVGLKDFAKSQMAIFAKQLELIRSRGLHTSTAAPHQAMAWTESPPDFEGYSKPSTTVETHPDQNIGAGDIASSSQGEEIMEREARNLATVIASGEAISSVIDSTWAAAQGLITPAALEATTKIAFKVAATGDGTFRPLYDEFNVLIEVTVTLNAAGAYALPDKLFAWPYFRLWTEASGSDVNQSADRTFLITQKS